MQIIYVIGGISPEYEGWLQVSSFHNDVDPKLTPNGDPLRRITKRFVSNYMRRAGQKYHLYWTVMNSKPLESVYHTLEAAKIPRYKKSSWFNTDVLTIRKVLSHRLQPVKMINGKRIYNYRRLPLIEFAKYLNQKDQLELSDLFDKPHNSREQRFKRDFYNSWRVSSSDPAGVHKAIRIFSAYLLLRNLVATAPNGCRKMFRKILPLNLDNFTYDLKLLDYKSNLRSIIDVKNHINSLKGRPFGTAQFTKPYLKEHVQFLKIFKRSFTKKYFNL